MVFINNNNIFIIKLHLQCNQSKLSSVVKMQLKTNYHVPNDLRVTNLRQKRSASKSEDLKLSNSFSTIKNSRRVKNASNEININNLMKKKNTIPNTITFTRSSSKASVVGKKNGKGGILNKTGIRSTKTFTPTETVTKWE